MMLQESGVGYRKKKQNNYIKSLINLNISEITYYLTNMFKTEATYGFTSPSFSDCIKKPKLFKSDIFNRCMF